MDIGAIKAIMCEIPTFDALQGEGLDVIASSMEYREVSKGTLLVKEGAVGDALFYIVEGKIEIKKEGITGKQAVLAHFSKGATVGEMALVEEQSTRSATAVTLEDTQMLVLTRESFDRILETNPRVAAEILRKIACTISQRLRATSGRFADILN